MNSHIGTSIIFLENNDFFTTTGQKGKEILAINPNISKSVVFFYISQGCGTCASLMNPYKKLPLIDNTDVKFIIADVQRNDWAIARKSNPTTTPITNVPVFIFYVNGRPYRKYSGPLTGPDAIKHIYNFAKHVSISIPEYIIRKVKPTKTEIENRGRIPECTIGIPLCGDEEELYLKILEAYSNDGGQKSTGQKNNSSGRQQQTIPMQPRGIVNQRQLLQPQQQRDPYSSLMPSRPAIDPYKVNYQHPSSTTGYSGNNGPRNQSQYRKQVS